MADWDDVRRLALGLPEVTEKPGGGTWQVKKKSFAWVRPLGKSDRKALGAAAPDGEILGIRVSGIDEKEALLAEGRPAVFTIPHFDGYPALLVLLDVVGPEELQELLTDAWLAMAPPKLSKAFL